jgi:hypothetical protein
MKLLAFGSYQPVVQARFVSGYAFRHTASRDYQSAFRRWLRATRAKHGPFIGWDSFYRLEEIAQRLKVVQFGQRDQRTIWSESDGPGT